VPTQYSDSTQSPFPCLNKALALRSQSSSLNYLQPQWKALLASILSSIPTLKHLACPPLQGHFLSMALCLLPLWPPEVSTLHLVTPLPFLCRPQHVSTPCKVAFFPCHDVSLPLQSLEVSALYWVALFPCPDRSLLLWALACQYPSRILSDSTGTCLPSRSGVSAQCQTLPCGSILHLPSPLLCHMPRAPTPRMWQWWLYQPR